MKKITISLLGLTLSVAPIATVVACGSSSVSTPPTSIDSSEPDSDDNILKGEKLVEANKAFEALGATEDDLGNDIVKDETKTYKSISGDDFTLTDVITTTFKNDVVTIRGGETILANQEVAFGRKDDKYYLVRPISIIVGEKKQNLPYLIGDKNIDQKGDYYDLLKSLLTYYDESLPIEYALSPIDRKVILSEQINGANIISIPQLRILPNGISSGDYKLYSSNIRQTYNPFVFDTYDSNYAFEKK